MATQEVSDGNESAALARGDEPWLPNDTSRPARVGLWALALGFGGFLLWAALAPLDEGVPTAAAVTIDTKRKTVQHPIGGIVRQVMVREGQVVAKGDALLRIDDAQALANYEAARNNYLTVRATEGRLAAEQDGLDKIVFHPDLLKSGDDPTLARVLRNQQQLFQSRRQAQQAENQAFEESMQGLRASIEGYQGMLNARNEQQASVRRELDGLRELVKEGYAPRNRQWELERLAAESLSAAAEIQGNLLRARSAIAETRLRQMQRQQEYRKEVGAQLADLRREVQADAEQLRVAQQEMERTVIRAPAEGQVLGLAVQTVGAVIAPGQKLMDIVPAREALLLEAKVPPHLIDRLRPGLPADVRFSAFAHSPALVVQGKVESVSSDLIIETQPPAAYYLARVAITAEGLRQLGNRQMQAGMPAEVIVKTGERSVLTYLLHPLLKRMAAAMKEE